jgi:hypothetical protein
MDETVLEGMGVLATHHVECPDGSALEALARAIRWVAMQISA